MEHVCNVFLVMPELFNLPFPDPPEEVKVWPEIVKVPELKRPDPVKCFGKGHPTLNYEWRKNLTTEVLSPTEDLNLPPLKRDESGRYICIASNKHGNKTAEVFFDVLCKCNRLNDLIFCMSRVTHHSVV